MDDSSVIECFQRLTVWRRGDERAPHKPLLILLALGRYYAGGSRLIPYSELDRPLKQLLDAFGSPRKSQHTEYPFWRLQNDGVWELKNVERCQSRKSNSDAKKSELLKYAVVGGLRAELYDACIERPHLFWQVSSDLLERCFPDSLHQDILEAVGLRWEARAFATRRNRDPRFRDLVLTAYEFRCAICGLDLRMAGRELGLEAAHIKWRQANGPDSVDNGLALCSLHHKLLDRGAIGLTDEGVLVVSESVHGSEGLETCLLIHHGKPIRSPLRVSYRPIPDFTRWHRAQVFRSPARQIPI